MSVTRIQTYLKENQGGAFFIASETNRFYLSGFSGTSGALCITEEKAYFITDFRYIEQANEQVVPNGFEVINQQQQTIFGAVKKLLTEQGIKTLHVESAYMTLHEKELISADEYTIVPTLNVVEKIREIKTEKELVQIRKAVEIIEQTFEYLTKTIKVGMSEQEVARLALAHVQHLGGSGMSFETIVASGKRSSLPHGVASEKLIEHGDIVTLDFGAYYENYVSDMTRTFFVGEAKNEKLIEIYNIVREAKQLAIAAIKPGVTTASIDKIARDYITSHGYGEFFGHGTGHGIGIDIHEAPRVSQQDSTILEPGMVITVEPGIYLPGIGGVRIEDDILVTKTGHQNLMKLDDALIIL